MIGKLKGLIDSYGEDYVILDVGGVGYQVHCSSRTLQALPSPGEAAVLSIETYVREDQIKLFGFRSDLEREWFRLLQTVQGVDSTARTTSSSTSAASAIRCIARRARCRRCPVRARLRRCRSKPTCARTRSGCSVFSAMPSANGSACCRPCRASARRWRWPCSQHPAAPAELAETAI